MLATALELHILWPLSNITAAFNRVHHENHLSERSTLPYRNRVQS